MRRKIRINENRRKDEEDELYSKIGNRSQYADPKDPDDVYGRQVPGDKAMMAQSKDKKYREYGRSKKHASKINESTIRRIVRESIKKVLREGMDDYDKDKWTEDYDYMPYFLSGQETLDDYDEKEKKYMEHFEDMCKLAANFHPQRKFGRYYSNGRSVPGSSIVTQRYIDGVKLDDDEPFEKDFNLHR